MYLRSHYWMFTVDKRLRLNCCAFNYESFIRSLVVDLINIVLSSLSRV